MISLNEYLLSKKQSDAVITSLDSIISKYSFEIPVDELAKAITDYIYTNSGWDVYISKSHINRINKAISKISSDMMFTNFISSDDDEKVFELNDEIQQSDDCKPFGHINIDNITIGFYKLGNVGDEICICELDDDNSTITMFIGKTKK